MAERYIHPFLESAQMVIEQVCNIKPLRGELTVKDLILEENHLWIKIGIQGQIKGDMIFGLHEQSAMKLISAMMGGYPVTEIDEMGRSAISELGNMISGNASMILFSQGITIDITPPELLAPIEQAALLQNQAVSVSLNLGELGEFYITVISMREIQNHIG